jgi:DNA-binding NarL/FixJ family response regulator
MRVVIAEDSVLMREGLVRLIEENGHEVVAAVGDGPSLVAAIVENKPEVSIVDVRMPPTLTDEGLRAAIEARALVPGSPILILSQYIEVRFVDELLTDRAGAFGYLLKNRIAQVATFLDDMCRVANGGTAIDPAVVGELLGRGRRNDPIERLTPREREVLMLMAEGRSNTAIGREMVVTDGAVEKHVRNIFTKLDLPPDDEQHRRVLAVLTYLQKQ